MLLAREELSHYAAGRATAITLGVFDGVHLGHRHLIDALKERAVARGLASGVVTLHPSPVQVLRPDVRVAYLTSLEERIELLRATGVDTVAPLTFTSEVAELSAFDFLAMLHGALDMRYLLMGPDNAFGRGREGTPQRVAEIADELGFELEVLGASLGGDDGRVSATAIRTAIGSGDMETAARLLGRPFSLRGPVVRGHERGRTIGFPTANMAVTPDRALRRSASTSRDRTSAATPIRRQRTSASIRRSTTRRRPSRRTSWTSRATSTAASCAWSCCIACAAK